MTELQHEIFETENLRPHFEAYADRERLNVKRDSHGVYKNEKTRMVWFGYVNSARRIKSLLENTNA